MIDFGAMIKTFIYLVSSSLLYPVILMLAILILVTVVQAGSFFAEWMERVRLTRCPPSELPDKLRIGPNPSVTSRVNTYIRILHRIINESGPTDIVVENHLQSTTLKLWVSMDRFRILVRVAPSLGLIGTLIPMGTGLAALGQGDMTQLTTDLVIAFTTTVVGLAIGTTAFVFYTVRRRWIEEDVKNMELATELAMTRNMEADHAVS
jgi:biopolymer transport protein ExbB/TolQ